MREVCFIITKNTHTHSQPDPVDGVKQDLPLTWQPRLPSEEHLPKLPSSSLARGKWFEHQNSFAKSKEPSRNRTEFYLHTTGDSATRENSAAQANLEESRRDQRRNSGGDQIWWRARVTQGVNRESGTRSRENEVDKPKSEGLRLERGVANDSWDGREPTHSTSHRRWTERRSEDCWFSSWWVIILVPGQEWSQILGSVQYYCEELHLNWAWLWNSSWPGFTHIKNELFLAGGQDQNPINDFRRISASEKVVKLQPLPTGKWFFPMPSWERQENVITLGGAVGGMNHLD